MRRLRTGLFCVCCLLGSLSSTVAQAQAQPQPQAQPRAATATAALAQPGLKKPEFYRPSFVSVARSVRPAVVTVTAVLPVDFFFRHPVMRAPQEPNKERRGVGAGVIVGKEGTILTNLHVVEGATELRVVLADGREMHARVTGADPKTDVAVIRLDPAEMRGVTLPTAPLGRSANLEVGEWVMAVGAPFGLKQTVSAGIVSALGRADLGMTEYEDFIQTDAAINPGNSGGPLVNAAGEVIGINTAIASRDGANHGVGFAIPVDMARRVMEQLVTRGVVTRGYLGATVEDLSFELAASFGYTGREGVLVQDVDQDGPATRAGLMPGDIIFGCDGAKVGDAAGFRSSVAATAPNTVVNLDVWRSGRQAKVQLIYGKLVEGMSEEPPSTNGDTVRSSWGLVLRELSPSLRERLRFAGPGGAVVAEVDPFSAADRAKLREGDVLIAVGMDGVISLGEAVQRLGAAAKDKPVRLRVVRDGHGMFVLLSR